MALDLFILQAGGGLRASVPALIANSSLFAKGVLLVLVLMSVYSWAVIWNRHRLFTRVAKADKVFLGAFRRLAPTADCRLVCEQHPQSLLARVALSGQKALDQHPLSTETTQALRYEIALRAMDRTSNDETAVRHPSCRHADPATWRVRRIGIADRRNFPAGRRGRAARDDACRAGAGLLPLQSQELTQLSQDGHLSVLGPPP